MNKTLSSTIFLVAITAGCSNSTTSSIVTQQAAAVLNTTPTGLSTTETAARIIFHESSFTNIRRYPTANTTEMNCLGDVVTMYQVNGPDFYSGVTNAIQFPSLNATDAFPLTERPSFINNVSVDMSFTYYAWAQSGLMQTDGCSYRNINSVPPSFCAEFDDDNLVDNNLPTTLTAVSPTPTPYNGITPYPFTPGASLATTGTFNSGFYRLKDTFCSGQGPIAGQNQSGTNSNYVGGINVDLNRSVMGVNENVMLTLTYQSIGPEYSNNVGASNTAGWPDSGFGSNDESVLRVRLLATGLQFANLIDEKQPRSTTDYGNPDITVVDNEYATLYDDYRGIRTEQFIIPLSANPLIDRIRIERIRGSMYIYQLDIYRMGDRE